MSSLVERLRIRSDRKPVYNLDDSDDDDFVPKKDRTFEQVEAIVRTDAKENACQACGESTNLVSCNTCTYAFHAKCLVPPLKDASVENWRCPECVSPLNEIDKILDCEMRPTKSSEQGSSDAEPKPIFVKQYLVKWKGLSYLHCSWVPEKEFQKAYKSNHRLKTRVNNFHRQMESFNNSEDDFVAIRPEWTTVDRILACREEDGELEYLVKYKELSYDECYWESESDISTFQNEIQRFKDVNSRTRRSKDVDHKRNPRDFQQFDHTPEFLKGLLHPYQLEGLNFLRFSWSKQTHVILADEMGLGKTIQSIALLASLFEENLIPHLVIAPLSTLRNWEREFATWAPQMNVVMYFGTAQARAVIREHEFYLSKDQKKIKKKKSGQISSESKQKRIKFDVLLTSYEMINLDSAVLKPIKWECMIVDEGHRLKNKDSKLFSSLTQYSSNHRILLTGTPLQNNLDELFMLMHFLDAGKFGSLEEFQEEFKDINQEEQISRLHKMLAPHLLRRVKKDVMKDMPPKKELILRVDLSSLQKEYYKAIFTRNYQVLTKKGGAQISLNNIMMELRKVCCHPYMLEGVEPVIHDANEAFKQLLESCGKLQLLDKMMVKLKEQGHRVLIYTQFQHMLDLLEDYCTHKKWQYERIDGKVGGAERQIRIDRFNAKNSNKFCFLLSTRAGGLGINLATADTVIIYDSDWNPHADLQAMARAHRLGQTNKVMIYRLINRGTIEERMMQLTKKKMVLEHLVVGKLKTQNINQEELDDIIRYGSKELFASEDDEAGKSGKIHYDDAAIDKLLDRDLVEAEEVSVDDEEENGFLKAFKVANFEYIDENEAAALEAQRVAAESKSSAGNSDRASYWEELLKDKFELHQAEELNALGKRKRSRKQLVSIEEDDLAGLEDVSSDGDESYEAESTDGEAAGQGVQTGRRPYRRKGRDNLEPTPLMEGEGRSFRVLGFNQSQRAIFVQTLMRYGAGNFDWKEFVPRLKQKTFEEINEYGILFLKHIAEEIDENSPTFSDGVPKEGLRIEDVLVRIALLILVQEKVKFVEDHPGKPVFPSRILERFPGLRSGKIWKEEHDKIMIRAVLKHGYGRWQAIVDDKELGIQELICKELNFPHISLSAAEQAGLHTKLCFSTKKQEIESLALLCEIPEESIHVPQFGCIAGSFSFRQWVDARSAVVALWDYRLQGKHEFVPELIPNVIVPSDMNELKDRLRDLFSSHILSLMENGEGVKKVRLEIEEKSRQVVSFSSKRGLKFEVFEKKKAIEAERDLVVNRLEEFNNAMKSILRYLIGQDGYEFDLDDEEEGDVAVFCLEGAYDWRRIHCLIRRECRRLEDGLPIYAYRRQILKKIHREQIMVLIGETGSGKSTQLVQFLADSGVAASESIVCTQPRKIAAMTLADRVREESSGCYEENTVSCTPTFSSTEEISSKVVYMTDNCLLQHYMKDRSLSGISCVIIDEAHERSLNTDLLLALLKKLLSRRIDLRLVIMSATADAKQLSQYFFSCGILLVNGRNFPVEIVYSPSDTEENSVVGGIASYVGDVVKMAVEIHKTEKEGTILAFLTSQAEVEWACERFITPSAIALPLHGKLSFEEQFRVFQNHPGRRKVIFATNIAETSLTIPGVKYVIDSGMVKESKYEPRTGMSILKVCRVSQSSARQRAGRAGRTEPGRCYRLYSKNDFDSMNLNQEPEIRRVHLGVALLRMLALGVNNIAEFNFVDAPVPEAIAMAVQNLVQLGAVVEKNGVHELTQEGHCLVKLGLEPKLGKLILGCFRHRMGKEGIVLAAVMANASSIFCRVGNFDDKMKADRLKVQFCNQNGDLFTLLSVYKEWASLPRERRNKWCWENSLNAKSMRRCEDTVKELEICIERELTLVSPSYWVWNPNEGTKHDKHLKMVILASLAENVAMYTGYNQLGYEVALTGQQVQLHPSCSLLAFGQKPSWVVFGELLSIVDQYLVCVTACDFEALYMLDPPPPFDVSQMDERRLRIKKVVGCSSTVLKRFCGKSNRSLLSIVSRARSLCSDERIGIQVDVDQNEIRLYAPPLDMEKVSALVNDALECEKKWMHNECLEKYLYHGRGQVPIALFGSGAQIKHLEVDQRFLTVDVLYYGDDVVDDRELLTFLEKKIDGSICSIYKFAANKQDCDEKEKWGRITFLTPESAMKATEIQKFYFKGSVLKLFPSLSTGGGIFKMPYFSSVTAKIRWPRRESSGRGCLKCPSGDIHRILGDISSLEIGTNYVHIQRDQQSNDSILISGLGDLSEAEVLDVLEFRTQRRDLNFFIFRKKYSVQCPSPTACEEELHKRIFARMSAKNPEPNCVQVQVFEPKEDNYFMRALIKFDGRLHFEAAKALQELNGEVLPGCLPWQKIKCEQLFQSSIICSASIYNTVKRQLNVLLARFERQKGGECCLEPTHNGAYRVKITAYATRPVAEMRRELEELLRGRPINHPGFTRRVLQHLMSRDGINLMRKIQQETETYILLDRHNLTVRICGTSEKIAKAEQELIQALMDYHESKQLEIHLRGPEIRPDLMKEVVKRFGPELQGIKEKVHGVDLKLNTRYHVIQVHGSKEMRQEVQKMVNELAREKSALGEKPDEIEVECPICLSEVDDGYSLEGCSHLFCKACLLEQFEASMRNFDAFPILCSHIDCGAPIVLADMRALLSQEKLDELFSASLSSFVTSSDGKFRFCSTPDCPSVYRVAGPQESGEPFICGACHSEICTRCHLEYHPLITCERYKKFKENPDLSLKDWAKGKNVKECPICKSTIEKTDGCNHMKCRCGKHICWTCLDVFTQEEPCYAHLRTIHGGIGLVE